MNNQKKNDGKILPSNQRKSITTIKSIKTIKTIRTTRTIKTIRTIETIKTIKTPRLNNTSLATIVSNMPTFKIVPSSDPKYNQNPWANKNTFAQIISKASSSPRYNILPNKSPNKIVSLDVSGKDISYKTNQYVSFATVVSRKYSLPRQSQSPQMSLNDPKNQINKWKQTTTFSAIVSRKFSLPNQIQTGTTSSKDSTIKINQLTTFAAVLTRKISLPIQSQSVRISPNNSMNKSIRKSPYPLKGNSPKQSKYVKASPKDYLNQKIPSEENAIKIYCSPLKNKIFRILPSRPKMNRFPKKNASPVLLKFPLFKQNIKLDKIDPDVSVSSKDQEYKIIPWPNKVSFAAMASKKAFTPKQNIGGDKTDQVVGASMIDSKVQNINQWSNKVSFATIDSKQCGQQACALKHRMSNIIQQQSMNAKSAFSKSGSISMILGQHHVESQNLRTIFEQQSKINKSIQANIIHNVSGQGKDLGKSKKIKGYVKEPLKGINGQIKIKDKRLQVDEVNSFWAKLKSMNLEKENTLLEAIAKIYEWSEFKNLRNRIKIIVDEEHKIAYKNEMNNEIAKNLFYKARLKEKSMLKLKITNEADVDFIKQRKKFLQKEALELYTKALIKIKLAVDRKIFIKSLDACIRLASSPEAKSKSASLNLTLVSNPKYALIVAEGYHRKAKKLYYQLSKMLADQLFFPMEVDKQNIEQLQRMYSHSMYMAKAEICRAIDWCKNYNEHQDKIIMRAATILENIQQLEKVLPPRGSITELTIAEYKSTNIFETIDVDSGPQLKAGKDLKTGDLVFYEHPVAFYYKGRHCACCWRSIDEILWPCPNCIEVYYCDQLCQLTHHSHIRMCGFTNFIHKAMGPIANFIYQLITPMSISQVIDFGSTLNDQWIEKKLYDVNKTSHTFNLLNIAYGYQLYSSTTGGTPKIHNLILSFSITLALLILEHITSTSIEEVKIPRELTQDEIKYFIVSVYKVFYYLYNTPVARRPLVREMTIKDRRESKIKKIKTPVGYGFGSFGVRLQRDCQPNVGRLYSPDGRIHYIAAIDIKAGDIITIGCDIGRKANKSAMAYTLSTKESCCAHSGNPRSLSKQRNDNNTTTTTTNNNNSFNAFDSYSFSSPTTLRTL